MADLSTPVIEVIDMFVKRKISSVPIVDEEGNEQGFLLFALRIQFGPTW